MLTRLSIVCALTLAATLAAGAPAWATIDNLKTYKQAYPEKAKTTSCKTCHEAAIGNAANLSGYGKALKQLPAPANPKKLTAEDYKAAEAADPDQDGATTLQELEAGTDPSDPSSVPPGGSKPNASTSKSGSSSGTALGDAASVLKGPGAGSSASSPSTTPAKPAAGAESQTGSGVSTGTEGGKR